MGRDLTVHGRALAIIELMGNELNLSEVMNLLSLIVGRDTVDARPGVANQHLELSTRHSLEESSRRQRRVLMVVWFAYH